ncbi:putative transporter small subunit [Halomonas urmiana]|nr:putative transporter small subunit [Halomonas urmiana]
MTLLYGFYVLVWPALTLGVLVLICRAVLRDRRAAKREHRELV